PRGGSGSCASPIRSTCWAGRRSRSRPAPPRTVCPRRSSSSGGRAPMRSSSQPGSHSRRRALTPDADLAFAQRLADAADAITLGRFRALDLVVETKPDLTPVSEADRAAEESIRALVARERPGEGVLGEEFGDDGTASRWIVDPIDGTMNYVRGIPVW